MTTSDEGGSGQILSQDTRGRVLVSRERWESLLAEYDRSGMGGVRFAQYLGINYTTLAHWVRSRRRQRQREKLLMKAGTQDAEAGRSNGRWMEAVVGRTVHNLARKRSVAETPRTPDMRRLEAFP